MKSVMLYFGSFNPVHNGHLAIAEYVVGEKLCDELWFVVSPRNPLKSSRVLADERDRFEMVRIAISRSRFPQKLIACDVEFGLPRPSYTIDTLLALGKLHRDCSFSVLCGSDITGEIERWKEWRRLVDNYKIYVYPRRGYYIVHPERFVVLYGAPRLDYSSTEIRSELEHGGDISGMVPREVADYIYEHKIWTQKSMDATNNRLEELRHAIEADGENYELRMERGKEYYRRNEFGNALNDFNRALLLRPSADEPKEFISIITDILEFRHKDLLNP